LALDCVPANASNGTGPDRHPGRTLTELWLKAIVDASQRFVGSVRELVDLLKVEQFARDLRHRAQHIAGDLTALPPED
jgi:hypothetical protein